jgi:Tol biopolymer transport system component
LPVGVHDVTITAPDGAEDTLEDGLTVTAGLGGAGGEGGAGAFRAPVPIPALLSPTSADDDPSVTEDLCDLFFASNRPGGLGLQDIWTSHRAAATDPWGAPTPVVELNSASTDALPGVAPNGLTIFFSSSRPGTVGLSDIWVATRADRYASWSEPLQATELNTVEDDLAPWVSFNGLQMVLTSTRAGGPGGRDLYWTTRVIRTAPWGEPTLIPGVNGVASDSEGRLARDGLALFFSSTRGGDGELYLAERLSLDDDFSTPAPITELSTLGNEADPWPSADGSYLLFSSDVSGSTEIYETSR